MDEPITVAVLAGTTRVQRESIKAAHYVADFAGRLEGVEVIFVDPMEFSFPGDGNDPEGKDPRYTEIVGKADAFFIVTPEYNHSFPGSLKRMLDSELALYNHKPVAFAGASDGNWGGVRAVEALLTAVRETGLVNDDGSILEEHRDRYERNLGKLFAELLSFARLFKQLRKGEQVKK
jgi:NAD(P)H-dependent FMN reductase